MMTHGAQWGAPPARLAALAVLWRKSQRRGRSAACHTRHSHLPPPSRPARRTVTGPAQPRSRNGRGAMPWRKQ
jgi:hypothetical protein